MSVPDDERPRPGVYARLAEQADVQRVNLTPAPWVRWVGRAICLAIAIGVVATALRAHPW